MKKYFEMIVLVGLIVAGAGLIVYQQIGQQRAQGNVSPPTVLNLTSPQDPWMNHSTASTTQTNLVYVGSASTSRAFGVGYADQVNFSLFGAGATSTKLTLFGATYDVPTSNTPLDLAYCYYFSNKVSTATSTAIGDAVSDIWFGPASNCATWAPGTIASTTIDIKVADVNAKYMRIVFRSPTATSTRFGLWA